MNEEAMRRWERQRAIGPVKFILLYGGLLCGLLGMGVLGQLIVVVLNLVRNDYTMAFWDESFTTNLVVRFALALPVGCVAGWAIWALNESKYKKAKIQ